MNEIYHILIRRVYSPSSRFSIHITKKKKRVQAKVTTDGLLPLPVSSVAFSESALVKLPQQVSPEEIPNCCALAFLLLLTGNFFPAPNVSASQSSLYSAFLSRQLSQNKLTHTHCGGQAVLKHSTPHNLLHTHHLFVLSVHLPVSPLPQTRLLPKLGQLSEGASEPSSPLDSSNNSPP